MVAPPRGDSAPDNVVALSRYRARLGRGRKLRRAETLLEGPDPERAVRALPGDEFYYVVHELGLNDAGDLLAFAKPEQIQAALDFALWDRDQVVPERASEWLEALSEAPYETIGAWVEGLDVELFALLVRKTARIYDISIDGPPEEPEGFAYPTPDGLFVLDITGVPTGEAPDEDNGDEGGEAPSEREPAPSARAIGRIIDSLYRADQNLARRLLVGARSELDSELEELAYRWRQGRMEDLGFSDYHEALEVYRPLDPASVRLGETAPGSLRMRTIEDRDARDDATAPSRAPSALVERLAGGTSPFSRAVQALGSSDEVAELHFALVALSNRVLAADLVMPGDDDAVAAALERLLATLDLGVEFLARGDAAREVEAVRTVPVMRLFRLGTSLIDKVKRLATTLRRKGPYAVTGRDLAEPEDSMVLEALTRRRPTFPGILDQPPIAGERPFRALGDLVRATAAVELAAAAQALLLGLGITPVALAPDSSLLDDTGVDDAGLDAGLLARTELVRRILERPGSRAKGDQPMTVAIEFSALEARDVRDFEALLDIKQDGTMKLPEVIKKKVKAILDAASPSRLAGAAAEVADRWIAGLAPLEPVLVRRPPGRPPRKR
jgi:Family of unknown function (DUF6178)